MKNAVAQDRRGSILRRDGLVIAGFLALTAVMTNPLVLHLADAVEDKQDGLLNTWIIAWVGHALTTDPLRLFDTNIFYPFTRSLAFSEILLPQGLLALPINVASANTILGYNLVLLFSLFLAAYGMYLLVYDWTRLRSAALVAGIIFAFNPYNLGNLAQIQLLSFGWMPLALLFLTKMLRVDSETGVRPRLAARSTILFAIFFSLQALSSIYYAMLAAFAVGLYAIWALVSNRLDIGSYVTIVIRLALSGTIIAVLTVPFLVPYLDVQRELGFSRSIQESEPFGASAKLYAEVSSTNLLYGALLAPRPPIINGCYPLDNLFPGIVAVGLAFVGIGARKRNKWIMLLLLVSALVLSLGPRLYVSPVAPTDITLPYRWLYDWIPLTHAFRAPVRFAALVMLALAVLAGFGVERVLASKSRVIGFAPNVLIAVLGIVVALEYLNLPAANVASVPTGDAIPQYVRWLAGQPHGLALELPMIEPACPLDLTAQYLSTYHWQDTPDGYSGFNPKPRGGIAYEMESFPSERSISLLQALGVKYVVVHGDRLPQPSTAFAQISDLKLVQRFGNDLILQVPPYVRDPLVLATGLKASVYMPQPAAPNAPYTAFLIIRNVTGRSYAVKPTQALRVKWQYNSVPLEPQRFESGETTVSIPLVTTSVSVVPIRIVAPTRTGDYRLLLSVRSDDFSSENLGGDLRVADEEPALETVLPASVQLAQPLDASYAPGAAVKVYLNWLALNKIDEYYSVSVRVVDSQGRKVNSQDREPAGQTHLWRPGTSLPDSFEVMLAPDLPKGSYAVQVLMYKTDPDIDALLLDKDFVPRKVIELAKFEVR